MEQNKLAKASSFFKLLLNKIARTCYNELPFIIISSCILLSTSQLRSFQGHILAVGVPNGYYATLGNYSIIFIYTYIGASIINYIKPKSLKLIYKLFSYFIVLLLFTISDFLLTNFNLTITPTCLTLLAETTGKEATEFINQHLFSTAIIPTLKKNIIYIFLIIACEFSWPFICSKTNEFLIKLVHPLLAIVSTILIFGCSYSIYLSYAFYNLNSPDKFIYLAPPSDPISSIITSSITLNKTSRNIVEATDLNEYISKKSNSNITINDSTNIIVVIGESYIKHHSQLYGYYLNTTPFLAEEEKSGHLFVFKDVISSSNYTSSVIKNILCCNNTSDDESWYKSPYFPNIFKSSGYNVYFWSNQKNFSKYATFTFTLDNFLFNPIISKISYTKTNNQSYKFDEDLINSFTDSINIRTSKYNLILFHLMGQHHNAEARFPNDKFKYFNADSINRDESYLGKAEKEYIADYDNATLYNDYVLHNIIEAFRNSNTILIYLSDHGEEVFDYSNKRDRDYGPLTTNKLKYQYEIPFMVWCSDIYKAKYPKKVNAIKNAVNRPFISDNLCNMLFNLGGIETPYYRDSLDLISPNYKCKKRILNHKYVYEDIRYSINE